ncbi:hypothetical protein QMK19_02265 [Streptomyces sp. H10-C2]|uniref:hypothetical protein n=1 Tax=unclassified Streptomyces TaxID=2593676 RepID=UPI0024B8EFC9|nr:MULTISPECIES: hypothetical protein [unclassified Streptomyces]MDJ0342611.1 hypothetical protein [Streptomyces sp. PH10-H1]MDJ0368535.1 hypothetical protein [Streptomyces sp. H10-C2]
MTTPYDSRGMDPDNREFTEETEESARTRSTPEAGKSLWPGKSIGSGKSLDELALRRLMKDAVQGIEPAPDALDHLRHAVPARRTRRRQAAAGVAAAVLLVCTAVPALLHAANTANQEDTTSAAASSHQPQQSSGQGQSGQDGTGWSTGPEGGESAEPTPSTAVPPSPTTRNEHGTTVAPTASGTSGRAAPACVRAQLGDGASKTGAPDGKGNIYGWFRVANVSTKICVVKSGGAVTATAQGSADSTKIQVVEHSTGDPATGLPVVAAAPLLLQPGQTYEVRFAWVPDAAGPNGCPVPPTPTPTQTTVGGATAGSAGSATAGSTANTPAAADVPPTPAPASVEISHTPEAGAPAVADTTIPGACAGTIYKTTALTAP